MCYNSYFTHLPLLRHAYEAVGDDSREEEEQCNSMTLLHDFKYTLTLDALHGIT